MLKTSNRLSDKIINAKPKVFFISNTNDYGWFLGPNVNITFQWQCTNGISSIVMLYIFSIKKWISTIALSLFLFKVSDKPSNFIGFHLIVSLPSVLYPFFENSAKENESPCFTECVSSPLTLFTLLRTSKTSSNPHVGNKCKTTHSFLEMGECRCEVLVLCNISDWISWGNNQSMNGRKNKTSFIKVMTQKFTLCCIIAYCHSLAKDCLSDGVDWSNTRTIHLLACDC